MPFRLFLFVGGGQKWLFVGKLVIVGQFEISISFGVEIDRLYFPRKLFISLIFILNRVVT